MEGVSHSTYKLDWLQVDCASCAAVASALPELDQGAGPHQKLEHPWSVNVRANPARAASNGGCQSPTHIMHPCLTVSCQLASDGLGYLVVHDGDRQYGVLEICASFHTMLHMWEVPDYLDPRFASAAACNCIVDSKVIRMHNSAVGQLCNSSIHFAK